MPFQPWRSLVTMDGQWNLELAVVHIIKFPNLDFQSAVCSLREDDLFRYHLSESRGQDQRK